MGTYGYTTEYQLGPIPIGPWTESYQNLGYVADGYTNEFTWRGTKITEWDRQSHEEIWDWNPLNILVRMTMIHWRDVGGVQLMGTVMG